MFNITDHKLVDMFPMDASTKMLNLLVVIFLRMTLNVMFLNCPVMAILFICSGCNSDDQLSDDNECETQYTAG